LHGAKLLFDLCDTFFSGIGFVENYVYFLTMQEAGLSRIQMT
jgi:hypothetical protein